MNFAVIENECVGSAYSVLSELPKEKLNVSSDGVEGICQQIAAELVKRLESLPESGEKPVPSNRPFRVTDFKTSLHR